MWEVLLWLSPIIALIAWGLYRRIKAREERVYIPRKPVINRCEHVDEPNHDRIACYMTQLAHVQGGIAVFSIIMLLMVGTQNGR